MPTQSTPDAPTFADTAANGGRDLSHGTPDATPSMTKRPVKPSHGSMDKVPVEFDDAD